MSGLRFHITILMLGSVIFAGCSTHYFLEGSFLEEEGTYTEAAAQFERARNGSYEQEAIEALIPIYLELNSHERALNCFEALEELTPLTSEQKFHRAETLMALGRYEEASEIFNEVSTLPRASERLQAIQELDLRQKDSIYYRVRPVFITSIDVGRAKVASAALPHRIENELYFVAESPRRSNQRLGNETFIDDYTGNRLMDLWKGEIVDTAASPAPIVLNAAPVRELNTEFHDGVVSHRPGSERGVLSKTYIQPELSVLKKLGRPTGERTVYAIQLFNAWLETNPNGEVRWETGERLRFCDEQYLFAHPALSPDGRTLYFTSDMPGGKGGMDIWSSDLRSGQWGDPVNLGEMVNTSGDEAFPTMRHADTLYFSSNGHHGMGGLDLMYASRSHGGEWSELFDEFPHPINSSRDDFGVQLDADGDGGIFASDREGIDNLYHFSSYDPQIILNVEIVHESDGSPWPGIEAELELVGGDSPVSFVSDRNGKWQALVDREKTYMIQCPGSFGYTADPFDTPEDQTKTSLTVIVPIPLIIEVGCKDPLALNYEPDALIGDDSCIYTLEEIPGCTIPHACNYDPFANEDDGSCEYESCITPTVEIPEEEAEDIVEELESKLDLTVEGDLVELKIHWDYDKADIRTDDLFVIAVFAKYLKENPDVRSLVISHCDSRSTESYNDYLSQARALSVLKEIQRYGIEKGRVVQFGASEQFLLHECEDEDDCDERIHQANRRTTAQILRVDEKVIVHRVKAGETLYGVSKKYSVSTEDIKSWNALKSAKMRVGQDILIYLPR